MRLPSHRRVGITLVEMSILIPIVVGLMALSGVVVQRAYTMHADSIIHWAHQRTLQSLCERWTTDIHANSQVVARAENILEIEGSQTVIYRTNDQHELVRQLWKNSKLVGVDEFSLGQPIEVTFSTDDTGKLRLMSMKLRSIGKNRPDVLATCYARIGLEVSRSKRNETIGPGGSDAK